MQKNVKKIKKDVWKT